MRSAAAAGRGKTVLITGATSGIGKATALELARTGFQVVIIGRRPDATASTATWLRDQTGNPSVDFLIADLTSQVQVRRVAREFMAGHGRLDVLINNAGGVFRTWALTDEGIERTWALNHLAPMLLSLELAPLLKASAPCRIVNVASSVRPNAQLDLTNQHERASFNMNAYSNAKLANVLATFALARRLADTGVAVNCLHPGVVGTRFGRDAGGWIKAISVLAGPFMLTPKRGAATSAHLATAPELEGVTGTYFARSRPRAWSPSGDDEERQEQVWRAALRELGAAPARIEACAP